MKYSKVFPKKYNVVVMFTEIGMMAKSKKHSVAVVSKETEVLVKRVCLVDKILLEMEGR